MSSVGAQAEALQALRSGIAILRTQPQARQKLGEELYWLGIAEYRNGEVTQSEACMVESAEVLRSLPGDPHPRLVAVLCNAAEFAYGRGDRAAAIEFCAEAVPLERRLLPSAPPEFAQTLRLYADLLELEGKHDQADALLDEALAFEEEHAAVTDG